MENNQSRVVWCISKIWSSVSISWIRMYLNCLLINQTMQMDYEWMNYEFMGPLRLRTTFEDGAIRFRRSCINQCLLNMNPDISRTTVLHVHLNLKLTNFQLHLLRTQIHRSLLIWRVHYFFVILQSSWTLNAPSIFILAACCRTKNS